MQVRPYVFYMSMDKLPTEKEMYAALMARDGTYDGVFFVAVRTTGIFCRPTCPARKPHRENVEFFATVGDALTAGYRPCKRCRPMVPNGQAPEWLGELLRIVETEPARRLTDADLRSMSIDPSRVRRWFRENYGMTFHAYHRAMRLGLALGRIRRGHDLTFAAFDHGYESLSGFREAFERLFDMPPGKGRDTICMYVTRLLTPLGPMVAGATDDGVCLLEFADRRMFGTQLKRVAKLLSCVAAPGSNAHLERLVDEVKRYFEGSLKEFTVELVTAGTPFQRKVWDGLLRIPYGRTCSYEELARDIGRPGARRAVGRANGDNRIAIIIPCHRVIGADGRLTGYGGGLWRKRFLLDHERANAGC